MRVLVLGTTSFVSAGLPELLARSGHRVVRFQRGPEGLAGNSVTGSVERLAETPLLDGAFDAVVNYIVLKDSGIAANVEFARNLCRLCRTRGVGHLIHLSSLSTYRACSGCIREDSPVETKPERKGPYGALKTAVDHALLRELPRGTKLTLLRPGFVLGPGLTSPIVGTAVRLPWNRLLALGDPWGTMPLTSRDLVNRALARILENPPAEAREVVMLVDPRSPSRFEFLEAVCRQLGAGTGVVHFPLAAWWAAAVGGAVASNLVGQGKLQVFRKISARLRRQRYDPSSSAARLGMQLGIDWKGELARSLPGQQQNFAIPPEPTEKPIPAGRSINFIGFGRVVMTKHLPALRRLGFHGRIKGFDTRSFVSPGGHVICALSDTPPGEADLHVVATPPRFHAQAVGGLGTRSGAVLIEKPACYTPAELRELVSFAASRRDPVVVCHNYRFRSNVLALLAALRAYNPGRLLHVFVDFSSPPTAADSAAWARRERESRTLLMDYSVHLLDLACLFSDGAWGAEGVRYGVDQRGDTHWIRGAFEGAYRVDFLLRQGFAPRRARISYTFQNYTAWLSFFPDTLGLNMAGDNPWYYWQQATAVLRATIGKAREKIAGRDADLSHSRLFAALLGGDHATASPLTLAALANFYSAIFQVAELVYGEP